MSDDATATERVLDVRTIDGPPFDDVMSALDAIADDGRLRLIAGFEPVPLYQVLEARGLRYETEQRDEEEWHVRIERE